jgi:hypothetical protein
MNHALGWNSKRFIKKGHFFQSLDDRPWRTNTKWRIYRFIMYLCHKNEWQFSLSRWQWRILVGALGAIAPGPPREAPLVSTESPHIIKILDPPLLRTHLCFRFYIASIILMNSHLPVADLGFLWCGAIQWRLGAIIIIKRSSRLFLSLFCWKKLKIFFWTRAIAPSALLNPPLK